MIRLLLIRHATTDAVGKRLSGRKSGVHLNEEGVTQAQTLAARLVHLPISRIYSSPLERAVETAAPLAARLNQDVSIDEGLVELDCGEWTDCTFDSLREQPAFQRFNTFRSSSRIPGGESMLEAQTRIVGVIQKLYERHPNETVALVSHSDLIKAALAHYAGIHLDMLQRLEISPASVSILDVYNETAGLLLMNDTGGIHP